MAMSSAGWAQAKTGIYITIDQPEETCDRNIKLLNSNLVYCISQEPIIELNMVEDISDITYDSVFQMRSFRIKLTSQGSKRVSAVATKLPNHKMAVVVNGILISILDLDGIYQTRTIVIWDAFDSEAIQWIYENLKDQVNQYTEKIWR